jgi:hypothetical protein
MLLRSDVRRLSIRQIRSQFPPRAFREMHSVRLQLGNVVVSVDIAVLPEPTCKAGSRRWLICPSCGSKTTVLGFVSSDPSRCGCRSCLQWRAPPRRLPPLLPSAATPGGKATDEGTYPHPPYPCE